MPTNVSIACTSHNIFHPISSHPIPFQSHLISSDELFLYTCSWHDSNVGNYNTWPRHHNHRAGSGGVSASPSVSNELLQVDAHAYCGGICAQLTSRTSPTPPPDGCSLSPASRLVNRVYWGVHVDDEVLHSLGYPVAAAVSDGDGLGSGLELDPTRDRFILDTLHEALELSRSTNSCLERVQQLQQLMAASTRNSGARRVAWPDSFIRERAA